MRLLALLVCLFATNASANQIVYLKDWRLVGYIHRMWANTSDANDFDGSWSEYADDGYSESFYGGFFSQESELGTRSITGQGASSWERALFPCGNEYGCDERGGWSTIELSFTVDEDSEWQLRKVVDGVVNNSAGLLHAGEVFDLSVTAFAMNRTDYPNDSSFSFVFNLLPVPEPSAAVLIGVGVAALTQLRGRRVA